MSFREIRRLIVGANHQLVALESGREEILVNLGIALARAERITDDQIAAACGAEDDRERLRQRAEMLSKPVFVQSPRGGRVAVLSFRGLVNYEIEFQPYAVSTKHFARTMRELAGDTSIKSIVIVFDSPGGMVTGTPEAADAVFAAREAKKVTAVVDTMAASAAYWVASQCSEIVCLPSGFGVGSIGVRMMHVECSAMLEAEGIRFTHIFSGEFKTEGNMTEPLTDAARARYQLECDAIYGDFIAAVARGRQVTKGEVLEKFGKGRLLMPAEAKKLGMLDRLELLEDSYRRLGVIVTPSESARAEEQQAPAPSASLELDREAVLGDAVEPATTENLPPPADDNAAAAKIDHMKRALDIAALE